MSRRNSKRSVYLIGSTAARAVKIGVSRDPEARLADLQTGSPVPLVLLWKTRGGQALEAALHAYFAPYRTSGEWFDFGEENPAALVATAAVLMGHRAQPERVQEPARYRYSDCTTCAGESTRRPYVLPSPTLPKPKPKPQAAADSESLVLAALAAGADRVPALVEKTGLSRATVNRLLGRLVDAGRAVRAERGQYVLARTEAA